MLIVADNIQITDRTIENALNDMNPGPIQEIARQCEASGAEALDINSGPLTRDPEKKMMFLVRSVQEVSSLPVLIDTSNPVALEAGLKVCRNKAIINGFSLEPEKQKHILPLAEKYETDIIAYLLNPNGHVPVNAAERLDIALELYGICMNAGMEMRQLIFDPVIVPLIWQNGNTQAMNVLSVLRTLPEMLGCDVRTIAGLSNLTAGKGNRDKKTFLEMSYASMLAEAGLSMVLMNVFHKDTIKTVKACNSLTSNKIFAWDDI